MEDKKRLVPLQDAAKMAERSEAAVLSMAVDDKFPVYIRYSGQLRKAMDGEYAGNVFADLQLSCFEIAELINRTELNIRVVDVFHRNWKRSQVNDLFVRREEGNGRFSYEIIPEPYELKIGARNLFMWDSDVEFLRIGRQDRSDTTERPRRNTNASEDPWNKVFSGDPDPEQPWYTCARYFAREHVKSDSSLLKKRDLLCQKIEASMKEKKIVGVRGKHVQAATINKALTKVSFD